MGSPPTLFLDVRCLHCWGPLMGRGVQDELPVVPLQEAGHCPQSCMDMPCHERLLFVTKNHRGSCHICHLT